MSIQATHGKRRIQDLTGRVFGRLTVVCYLEKRKSYHYWKCKCSCGVCHFVETSNLTSGRTKSCGCFGREVQSEHENLIGKKFGHLMVTGLAERRGGEILWNCRCSCDNEAVVSGPHLKSGHTKSCGCWQQESREAARTHGYSGTRVYVAWNDMVRRCNPETVNKHRRQHYVNNGVIVCSRWMKFENFLADMGEPPTPKHEVDRINNNGNYEPGNCRWATRSEQMRNQSGNKMVSCRGEIRCIAEWSDISGVPKGRISKRLKDGWDAERAIFVPPRVMRRGGAAVPGGDTILSEGYDVLEGGQSVQGGSGLSLGGESASLLGGSSAGVVRFGRRR